MSASRNSFSLLATVTILALAAVAGAQDHGRDHDKSSGKSKPSRSRAHQDRSAKGDRGESSRPGDRSSPVGRSSDGGRYNPFDRSSGRRDDRGGGSSPVGGGRATLGAPIRDQRPDRYDGRGSASPQRFGAPPSRTALGISISNGRFGGTEVAVGAKIGGLRVGFVSYSNPRPVGYAFAYPYYAYDPYATGALVVASPWYGYSYLPPYLDRSRVVIVDRYPAWTWDGWQTVEPDGRRTSTDVKNALDDLRDAFEEESGRIADRLIPEEGDIAIFNEGNYDYSLNPDDFQKMFLDGVEQSKTVHYDLLDVRTRGDEIRVRARHTYTDSWGQDQSVVHRITFRRENGGDYVIREFGTE